MEVWKVSHEFECDRSRKSMYSRKRALAEFCNRTSEYILRRANRINELKHLYDSMLGYFNVFIYFLLLVYIPTLSV